jgi:hypothetical protein
VVRHNVQGVGGVVNHWQASKEAETELISLDICGLEVSRTGRVCKDMPCNSI